MALYTDFFYLNSKDILSLEYCWNSHHPFIFFKIKYKKEVGFHYG